MDEPSAALKLDVLVIPLGTLGKLYLTAALTQWGGGGGYFTVATH